MIRLSADVGLVLAEHVRGRDRELPVTAIVILMRPSHSANLLRSASLFLFFFNDTATTEIYTLSLHDALPISHAARQPVRRHGRGVEWPARSCLGAGDPRPRARHRLFDAAFHRGRHHPVSSHGFDRSEEHTSELQSLTNLVCRLLLEKKKKEHDAGDTDTLKRSEQVRRVRHIDTRELCSRRAGDPQGQLPDRYRTVMSLAETLYHDAR